MTSAAGWTLLAALTASAAAMTIASSAAREPRAERASGFAVRKGGAPRDADPAPLLGTLVETHTGEHLPFDAVFPDEDRFDALLADRVTGSREHLDPRLLALLRRLGEAHRGARLELVSGYRSPKLNETLRKKGHHVASHSQHSLGHAVDFRVVPPGEAPMDPRLLEREIREGGWTGGTGVYVGSSDRFVHADVGPTRRWNGL